VIVLALVSGTGGAAAAVPPAGTIGPANASVSWQGQPYAVSATSDPRFCAPQAADPINLTCDHFTLHVEAPGTVTATISWPEPADDFDLYVCTLDPASDATDGDACTGGREVASSAAASGTSETVTFSAPAAGVYELRVVPLVIPVPSAYAGTATYTAPAGGGGGGGASCSPATLEVNLRPLVEVCIGL
jgi:hypothetical protein